MRSAKPLAIAVVLGLLAITRIIACTSNGGANGGDSGSGNVGGDGGSGNVGTAGGTIRGPDGTDVIVPPGALGSDENISLQVAPPGQYPAIPSAYTGVTKVYAFLPHGLTFNSPVTIEIPIPSAMTNLVALHADPSGSWKEVPATFGANAEIAATSFSFFTVATKIASDAGPSDGGVQCIATFTGGITGTATCTIVADDCSQIVNQNNWILETDPQIQGFDITGPSVDASAGYIWKFSITIPGSPSAGTFNGSIGNSGVGAGDPSVSTPYWAEATTLSKPTDPQYNYGSLSFTLATLGPSTDGGAFPGDKCLSYLSPHGSLTATLVDQSKTSPNTQLSVTF